MSFGYGVGVSDLEVMMKPNPLTFGGLFSELDLKVCGVVYGSKFPLNTCQVCRLVNGFGVNDIGACRKTKVVERGLSNFLRWGHQPYEFCLSHVFRNDRVRGSLRRLERLGFFTSVYLRHHDPQKVGRHWDRMRFYGVDLSPVTKQHLDHYFGGLL